MNIQYRKMTENDLETFITMRIAQLREEGATEDVDLVPPLMDYYHRHMADGTFVSWLAVDGEKIIGTSGMSFVEKPPYFSCPSGRIGLLWIPPDGHRKGAAPTGGGGSARVRLRKRADYGVRYGRAAVHGLRF